MNKEKVLKSLITGGSNPTHAKQLLENNYDYVNRVYPNLSPKKTADIIRSVNKFR